MSYTFTQTELGAGNIQLDVLWSVNAQSYILQSNLQFTQLLRTIFDVADYLATSAVPDYRLLRPAPATGGSNVAAGANALQDLTTGTNNSAFGSAALRFNLTGSSNCAFGSGALNRATGTQNVGVGANCLVNSTGLNNSAFGYAANGNITTASNNTAIGAFALLGNTTGASNTALGEQAGIRINTGSSNTILGREANVDTAARNNCIAIGREAVAGANGDGQIAIGSAAYPVLLSGSAGASSGQHLDLLINGTRYKIALLNV